MGYNCVVCIKQVPDTGKVTGDAMKADGTINRAALPAIFNPEDQNALEAALKVRDQHGGTVTVITMGLPSACAILREALMCGADKAYLVTDRRAAASDTLATSYILAQAVKMLKPDLVFCGRQAIDGDTAQTGPQIAEKLGATLVTYLEGLEIKDGYAYATRNIGTGTEKVKAKLPALFTVMEKCGELRPFEVRRAMKYKKARAPMELSKETAEADYAALKAKGLDIGQWSLDDIACDLTRCGKAGSPTLVNKIVNVVLSGGEFQEYQPTDEDVGRLVGSLIADHTIG
ncbi:MAG: electron transfer flavoprotein subunit beta/FixA family protein [Kiritimatiellae bacterium]|nr:electron transfer flavoprotein subunit beta/FixA family protein [Kiritimatiellia bacterium]